MLNQFKYKSVRIAVRPKVISFSYQKVLSLEVTIMELPELHKEHRIPRILKRMMIINQLSKMFSRKKFTYLNLPSSLNNRTGSLPFNKQLRVQIKL